MSIYIHDEKIHNFKAAEKILPLLINKYNVQSVLDVGTGIGTWLNVAESYGVNNYFGIDGNWVDRKLLKIPENFFIEFDLNSLLQLSRRFDLVLCLEVAEHLPEKSAATLIESLISHGDLILFSAAIPNQGGQNHLNEQFPCYWVKQFNHHGYNCFDYLRPLLWNDNNIEWWYRQNIFLASKNYLEPITFLENEVNLYIHPDLFYKEVDTKEKHRQELNAFKQGKKSTKLYAKLLLKSLFKS